VTIGSGDHHVLAVHGWFGSARGWGSLPDYLDGSRFTYAFMDLRGYGDRQQVGGEFTMAEAAADALALADELGWDRFSVIGHSMGGKAAHQILLQAPERVRKLVGLSAVSAAARRPLLCRLPPSCLLPSRSSQPGMPSWRRSRVAARCPLRRSRPRRGWIARASARRSHSSPSPAS